jgi:hypothetical protein
MSAAFAAAVTINAATPANAVTFTLTMTASSRPRPHRTFGLRWRKMAANV